MFDLNNGVLLANDFLDIHNKPTFDPKNWWLSEKYDGERAIWINKQSKMFSRKKNEIKIPTFFSDLLNLLNLDDLCLDGELYFGKNTFEDTGIFRSKYINKEIEKKWKNVKYMVFDIPNLQLPFEERMNKLNEIIKIYDKKCNEQIIFVKQIKIQSIEHFNELFNNLLNDNAEGAMLRQPNSFYIQKRSDTLLKCKITQIGYAKIIGYNLGKNKNAKRLGSFIVQDKDIIFNISGMNDKIRNINNTHPIGTIINYYYRGLFRNGTPREPTYKNIKT
jgi:DNA ligase-1